MLHLPNLLLIAGTGRNIGKTTLATSVIRRNAGNRAIIGLKVSSIYPSESAFHGVKNAPMEGNFVITEELDRSGIKDTSKMLLAGAARVFYVRVKDNHLEEAMSAFFQLVDSDSVIVCESGSLRSEVNPGLFVMIRQAINEKPRTKQWVEVADMVIDADLASEKRCLACIVLTEKGWQLNKELQP